MWELEGNATGGRFFWYVWPGKIDIIIINNLSPLKDIVCLKIEEMHFHSEGYGLPFWSEQKSPFLNLSKRKNQNLYQKLFFVSDKGLHFFFASHNSIVSLTKHLI